jgi:hypothetical protein
LTKLEESERRRLKGLPFSLGLKGVLWRQDIVGAPQERPLLQKGSSEVSEVGEALPPSQLSK